MAEKEILEERDCILRQVGGGVSSKKRRYFSVRYEERETAKNLGARWDSKNSGWYSDYVEDQEKLEKRFSEISCEKLSSYKSFKKPLEEKRRWLNVPFSERKIVKALGAIYDSENKRWYLDPEQDLQRFHQWLPNGKVTTAERTYLNVPYEHIDKARKVGLRFDREHKVWFAPSGIAEADIIQWKVKELPLTSCGRNPTIEFKEAMCRLGLDLAEDPIMNGTMQRCRVLGDGRSQKSGAYVGSLIGRPWGYIKNHKTQEERNWIANGVSGNSEEFMHWKALAAQKELLRKEEERSLEESTKKTLLDFLPSLKDAVASDYTIRKRIDVTLLSGAKCNDQGALVIPIYNFDYELQSLQTIYADGSKRYAKRTRKEGGFFPINGIEAFRRSTGGIFVIAEGIATAATIAQILFRQLRSKQEITVFAAFDASNLLNVAQGIRARFPHTEIIIAGDDDAHTELMREDAINVGKHAAYRAAERVNGTVIFPPLTDRDKSWPKRVSLFTALEFKRGALTIEQKEALRVFKRITDFNDVALLLRDGEVRIAQEFERVLDCMKMLERSRGQLEKVVDSFKGGGAP